MENPIKNKYIIVEDIIRRKDLRARKAKCGYKGVHRDSRPNSPNRYRSVFSVGLNQKNFEVYLGTYDTPEEAYLARIKFIDSLK
jgi:hypothetical protein